MTNNNEETVGSVPAVDMGILDPVFEQHQDKVRDGVDISAIGALGLSLVLSPVLLAKGLTTEVVHITKQTSGRLSEFAINEYNMMKRLAGKRKLPGKR